MSMQPVSVAERLAYGRVEDAEDRVQVHLVPRPMTALIGRVLLAAIFLVSGFAKVTDTDGTVAHMVKAGIPAPEILVWIAAAAELCGAAARISGFLTRLGAIALILFLIPTTYYFHDFWNLSGPEQVSQMANFMKNLAIAGGLTLLIAYGPGRYSLDHKLRWPIQA